MDLMQSIIAHLTNELDVRVATERPANPPKELVTVVRTGGGGSRFYQNARVVIHAWSTSDLEAYELGTKVADAMFTLPAFAVNVFDVTQNSFYSNIYTDGTRRWSSAFDIAFNR